MANSKSRIARGRLFTSTLLAGAAALGAPAAVGLVASLAPVSAMAQDYTSGTLSGRVSDSAGAPVSGARVTVRSQSTGVTQTSTTDGSGGFRAPLVPAGSYTVTIAKEGFSSSTQADLAVRSGGESNYGFTLSAAGGDVSEVVVVAKKAQSQLDFSQTTTGLAIDVEQLTKQVPIGRSLTSLILLAPGTVQGTASNFRGLPSIGGSSVAENAYYINGLNITDFDNYLGSTTVPFDFYKSVETKTGGYPAEFGRATGGVVNAVTKSGTNEFYFGVHGNYAPDALRSNPRSTFIANGNQSYSESKDVSVEAGGPIIKDHLFFYGLVDLRDTQVKSAGNQTGAYNDQTSGQPFYGVKLDGYITSRQHVEATYFRTNDVVKTTVYDYTPDADPTNLVAGINNSSGTVGARQSSYRQPTGGENFVFKYTGTFTDWFTLSGAYGRNKNNKALLPELTSEPVVTEDRDGSGTFLSRQTVGAIDFPYRTKRDFYRIDADLYVNFLGRHHFRAGYDHEDDTLDHLNQNTGFSANLLGGTYDYLTGGARNPQGVPTGQDYLAVRYFATGGTFNQLNEAIYVQDSWDVLKNSKFGSLTLNLGLRRDQFTDRGGASAGQTEGDVFVDFDNELGPRIGATWDPLGDGQNKIFANFGRYYLPVASNTGFRQASPNTDFTEYYNAPAGGFVIDPVTGLPATLGSQITQATNPGFTSAAACVGGGRSAAGVVGCTVNGDGSVQPFAANISRNLKSTQEDEYILGYSHKFNSLWTAGATVTYRILNRVSEDAAIDVAVRNYCAANGIVGCGASTYKDGNGVTQRGYTGFRQYTIINPGFDQTITLRQPLPGQTQAPTIDFSTADLHYPKAKREYYALDLDIDRAFDGKWAFHGTYTLSKSIGNYEGFVKSDAGNGQTDSGITQDFDQPSLVVGAYGLLPNHHAHVFKGYGSYAITNDILLGLTGQITSPRHYGCIGLDPTDPIVAAGYGPASFYCQGQLVERSSAFTTPWTFNLDMSVRYSVPKVGAIAHIPGNLVLRADVFNILNQQSTIEAQEVGDLSSGEADPNYGRTTSYQPPRYVRVGFDLTF